MPSVLIKKKISIAILGFLCLLAIGMVAIVLSSNKGEIVIVNEATHSVLRGEIEVCKQRFKLGQLKPKDRHQILYKVWSDSAYEVTIEFESGKRLTRKLGYVTSGVDFKDTLIVKDQDLILRDRTFHL